MNKIVFIDCTETQRLRKIIRNTRNKELSRRVNAVLLVLKGHPKAEVARMQHAGRSSVIHWMTWYEVAGAEGGEHESSWPNTGNHSVYYPVLLSVAY